MQKNFFKNHNLKDIFLFGRVLSTGIVIAGYAFLGVWLANYLSSNGWNKFFSLAAIPVLTGFGMWQAWLFLTKTSSKNNNSK